MSRAQGRALLCAALTLSVAGCKGDKGDTGPAGASGEPCTVAEASGKVTVTCSGTTVTLPAGANGVDGKNCTLKDNGDGTKTITCGEQVVTVSDGKVGTDGKNCTLTDVGGVKTVTCPDGSSFTVADGKDGENCSVAQAGGVKTITCPGGSVITISDGKDAVLPAGAGAKITVQSVTLAATGAPTVTFQITDAAGKPVDLLAEFDAGAVAPKFVLASRSAAGVYTSLYTSTSTGASYKDATGATVSPVLASTTVAAYVPPRSLAASAVRALYAKVSDGVYTFTFPSAPAAAPTLTLDHTLSIYGTRTFAGTAYPFHAEHHFNPAAGAAAAKREVVSDAACNGCHQNMQAHDSRRGVGTCLTCHSPQTTDPETGNTMDLRVMVHKIHRGAQGTDPASPAWKYQVVGYGQALMDFSHVSFAAPGNTVRNCSECHQGAQADNFKTKPSIAACGSCHYTVDFATGTGHQAGAKADGSCAACHDDADIAKVHSPNWDPANNVLFTGKALDITIDDVTNVVAGATPVITFTVKVDGVAYDAKANPLAQLRFTVAGPATDYAGTGAPAAVGYVQSTNFNNATNAALLTATGTAGQFTAPGPVLAATAAGTMAFGVEAYIAETKADAGGTNRTRNWPSKTSAVVYKAIGGGTATARREIVDDAKCNACHVDLGFHSNSSRKNARYCAFCHNPNNLNDERVARYETGTDGNAWKVMPESVQLSVMVHKIHMGGELSNAYTLGGNPGPSATNPAGTPNTITGAYPGDIGNCLGCHKPGTYGLPNEKLLATKMETWKCIEDPEADTDSFCDPLNSTDPATWVVDATTYLPPQASACTSCHDGSAAKAHAALNTYNGIETCAVCHGAGKDLDPVKVHQARP